MTERNLRVEILAKGIEAQSMGNYTLLGISAFPAKFNSEPYKTHILREAAGFFTEALAHFSEIRYFSGQASALGKRAICFQMLGEPDRALEDFNTALKISPLDQRTRLKDLGARYSLKE